MYGGQKAETFYRRTRTHRAAFHNRYALFVIEVFPTLPLPAQLQLPDKGRNASVWRSPAKQTCLVYQKAEPMRCAYSNRCSPPASFVHLAGSLSKNLERWLALPGSLHQVLCSHDERLKSGVVNADIGSRKLRRPKVASALGPRPSMPWSSTSNFDSFM